MVFHIVGGIFAILVGIGLICYAVGKIKESNKKYSLHVEATCIGYHAVEDQIEKDYLEKPTDLSMNGGKKEMEKSEKDLKKRL